MTISNLQDLYIDQLQDLYSACDQAQAVVGDLAGAARNQDLIEALNAGVQGIPRGMQTIAEICGRHGADPTGEHCKGMEGLVTEARKHGLEADFGDDDTRDAAIITQYQRLTHYAIAGYGSVRTFANRLGHERDAAALQDCLDHTRSGDEHMTRIAERDVNKAAID